jgi:very-short-patch-repair endonuclease
MTRQKLTKADAAAHQIALSLGLKLCACGKVEANCEEHAKIPPPSRSAPYSYMVRDPKSGFYPGSFGHRAWKAAFREKLRNNPTPAEKELIIALEKEEETRGLFIFQGIVFGFIPDFASPRLKVIIEVDGAVHNTTAGKRGDGRRDNIFRRNGWIVKRFNNAQVMCRQPDVMSVIIHCVRARLDGREQGPN